MPGFLVAITMDIGSIIDIVSCAFTVFALVFTLYFWLLDKLNDDETEFLKGRNDTLKSLRQSLESIKASNEPKVLLDAAESVERTLETVINYRFWSRGKRQAEYAGVKEFYEDTRYLISALRRYQEQIDRKAEGDSLIDIKALGNEELEEMRGDYRRGLFLIAEFIEDWE